MCYQILIDGLQEEYSVVKSGKYKLEYIEEQDPDNEEQIIVRLVHKGENLVDMFSGYVSGERSR